MKSKFTTSPFFLNGHRNTPYPFTNKFYKRLTKLFLSVLIISCANLSSAQITAGFELDGNAIAVAPNPADDWNLIYMGNTHSVNTGIVVDFPKGNDNAFKQGSKDLDDISAWRWDYFSAPAKDDILHAGAALYNNDKIYFFGDRYATNGDAQIGFWLFKNAVGPNPDGTFYGPHAPGDILLLSNFVNGGGIVDIRAYEWVGSGGSDGPLNEIPVDGSKLFAIVNSSNETSPWPFDPKFGPNNVFSAGAFFEGGIDLANLGININPCFTSFLLETRTSQSIHAELKDFVFGSFFTQPQVTVNSAAICPGGGPVTLNVNITGGSAPFVYSWSNGATTSSITVSPSVTTTYTITVTSSSGCVSQPVTSTVTVNPSPGATATGGMINCIANSVQLTASSSTSGVNYSWTGPNGFTSSQQNPTVNDTGTYTLIVTNPSGCTSSATAVVTQDVNAPNVTAAGGALNCGPGSVQLTATTSVSGVTYSWTGPNGFTSSQQNPTVIVSGTYTVTVTDPANGCTGIATAVVTQNSSSISCFLGSYSPYCGSSNNPLNVYPSGGATPYNYSWSVTGTGWSISSGANTSQVMFHAGSSGSFGIFSVVITDANGCSTTCSDTLACHSPRPASQTDPSETVSMAALPNPFSGSTTIDFIFNTTSADAAVEIFSAAGAKVAELYKGHVEQGKTYQVNFDASLYAEGMYFCRITADGIDRYLKLMLIQ
jgi:uncharacterized repeat protein (TIGR01451 family)